MWNALVGLLSRFIVLLYDFTVVAGFPSYGIAIIIFTVIIRLLMFPLSLKQAKSSRMMQLVQPKLQQLQQQYKNSPEILNREMSSLYKKYKISPMSGCLPLIIQMPILFALFSALRNFTYVGEGSAFLWLPNLSDPDPTIILPIVTGISTYLQSKITMASQPTQSSDQAKMMNNTMLYVMPLMLAWMTRTFASGLALYWSTTNLVGAVMQMGINAKVRKSHESLESQMKEDEKKEELIRAEKAAARVAQKDAQRKKQEEKKKLDKKRPDKQNRNKNSTEDNRGKPLDFDDLD